MHATTTRMPRPARPRLRLTAANVNAAADDWGFNCGPAALCAVSGLTPDHVRPHLLDFEEKGYTNPTLMAGALRRLGLPFSRNYQRADPPAGPVDYLPLCLVRIQWGGRWTEPGVPMAARYLRTHWIAVSQLDGEASVFDVNTLTGVQDWVTWAHWSEMVVPWVLGGVAGNNGTWWPTHIWAVHPVG